MSKTLCDWSSRKIDRDFAKLASIIAEPRFVCRKCARSACRPRYLCKPKRLPKTLGVEADQFS